MYNAILFLFTLLPLLSFSQRLVGRVSLPGYVGSSSSLRMLGPVSLTCPGQSFNCPSNNVCCLKKCCSRRLPFCVTPLNGAPICGTAEGKVECTASDGRKLLGTLCSSNPSECCPFPGFQRCTPEGPLHCVNQQGFIRCVVDGASKPGVLCPGEEGACCPNPSRCCGNGGACCTTGEGGPLPLDPFPQIVLGIVPSEAEKEMEPMESPEARDTSRKMCREFQTRTERRRCVRLRRKQRRLCLACRMGGEEACDEICGKEVI